VKSKEDIKKVFEENGVDLKKPLICTCQRAVSTCYLYACLEHIGVHDCPVYDGSYAEYSVMKGI
jgi:thiosulfate/3-mercaptopyruvate sulfurtransferase